MRLAQPHHDGRIDGIPAISPPLRPVHWPWAHNDRLVANKHQSFCPENRHGKHHRVQAPEYPGQSGFFYPAYAGTHGNRDVDCVIVRPHPRNMDTLAHSIMCHAMQIHLGGQPFAQPRLRARQISLKNHYVRTLIPACTWVSALFFQNAVVAHFVDNNPGLK